MDKAPSQLGLWAAASACFALAAAEPIARAASVSSASGVAAIALWVGLWLALASGRSWAHRTAGSLLALVGASACAGFGWLAFEHWTDLSLALRQASLTESSRRFFWGACASLFWLPSCLVRSRLALFGLAGSCAALFALVLGVGRPF